MKPIVKVASHPPIPPKTTVAMEVSLEDANLLRSFLGETFGPGLYDLFDELDHELSARNVAPVPPREALDEVLGERLSVKIEL